MHLSPVLSKLKVDSEIVVYILFKLCIVVYILFEIYDRSMIFLRYHIKTTIHEITK